MRFADGQAWQQGAGVEKTVALSLRQLFLCRVAVAALASAALVWKQSDYGYYQRLMAAAAELYATSKAIHGSCAPPPMPALMHLHCLSPSATGVAMPFCAAS